MTASLTQPAFRRLGMKALLVQHDIDERTATGRAATALAEEQGILDQFQEAMSQDDEKFVKLKTPIPVRLIYQTAFWDGSAVRFRPDVYGWDDNVAKAIGLAPGAPVKIEQPESSDDIGP